MGYYTDYTLNVYGGKNEGELGFTTTNVIPALIREELAAEIEKMEVFDSGGDFDFGWYANLKWYDHDDDMLLLSKRFPEVVFCLHGDGEDSEDLWDAYYFDGMMQHCPAKIVYDDFDFTKLSPAGNTKLDCSARYSYQTAS